MTCTESSCRRVAQPSGFQQIGRPAEGADNPVAGLPVTVRIMPPDQRKPIAVPFEANVAEGKAQLEHAHRPDLAE